MKSGGKAAGKNKGKLAYLSSPPPGFRKRLFLLLLLPGLSRSPHNWILSSSLSDNLPSVCPPFFFSPAPNLITMFAATTSSFGRSLLLL